MNQKPTSGHPCERREPLSPWKPDHLYVADDGVVLCGRCMGVESTFTPWAWSDLGAMGPDRSLRYPGHPMDIRCETDRYARR